MSSAMLLSRSSRVRYDRRAIQTALRTDAHPLFFYRLLTDLPDSPPWYGWAPETIRSELTRVYGCAPSAAAMDTIAALQTCLLDRRPWKNPHLFGHVAVGLAAVADLTHNAQPTPGQCLLAVWCMQQIDDKTAFSEEVRRYQAAVLLYGGIVWAGDPLTAADFYLRGYPHRPRARRTFQALVQGIDPGVDDDDPGRVSGAKWWAAYAWANQRNTTLIYEDTHD